VIDRLDGKAVQAIEHGGPDGRAPLTRIVHEFVHLQPRPQLEQRQEKQEPLDVEWKDVTKTNGNGNVS